MNDEYITFSCHDIKLEGYLCVLEKRPAIVICHPHPLHGGTMNNSVVLALRNAAWKLGIGTLRFNFRGTGRSEGTHTDGVREIDDTVSAIGYLRAQGVDTDNIYIAGYSFGAGIALKVACLDERIKKAIAVASPAQYDYDYLRGCRAPKLFILGEYDDVAPPKKMQSILKDITNKEIKIVRGADHFFSGELDTIRDYTEDFLGPVTLYKNGCGR